MNDKVFCGIDFGTSNSTCAVFANGRADLVPLEDSKLTLPSAIFYSEDGDILFGRDGVQAYIEGEDGRLLRGLKSVLGTALMSERTVVNGSALYFKDILATFLRRIKLQAEAFAGCEVTDVVMGRPVHFHDDNPEADDESQEILRQIAEKIGFKNVHFQYEPIAAAFAHEQRIKGEKLSLIVDLGGGTSDFTVIRLSPDRPMDAVRQDDILSTSGIRVGGTNFDQRLSMKAFMPHLGLNSEFTSIFDEGKILDVPSRLYSDLSDWPRVNFAQTSKAIREAKDIRRTALEPEKLDRLVQVQEKRLGHAFLQEVEKTKIALSDTDVAQTSFDEMGLGFEVSVEKTLFENAVADQIARIRNSMEFCLSEAGVKREDIDLVVLTGGSSELPVINQMVSDVFPSAEISKDDKFCSVGLGLAYHAAHLFS